MNILPKIAGRKARNTEPQDVPWARGRHRAKSPPAASVSGRGDANVDAHTRDLVRTLMDNFGDSGAVELTSRRRLEAAYQSILKRRRKDISDT